MVLYRICVGIDLLMALIAIVFFFWGISDGTVSSFNILIWLALLGGIAAILGGGMFLKSKGQVWAANGVLFILALPGIMGGIFVLAIAILQPRWN
jgi:hypothetical protein